MKRHERSRISRINKVEQDAKVKYCYIIKAGWYYREHSCGYTEHVTEAGVYRKEVAIKICKLCIIEEPIPINAQKHNQQIIKQITALASRIIKQ
ncbi:hypothetical protein F0L74_10045 [Chitinophaga agrisoli]|uniref:Uncharacterized protein n=1 Tax=Chitinophaga agrisoli TaxID=2607653 RepID=A0A5B2VW40_9BACT|nr:hypothetical protein [Chitinophaga agrisoli]KAA2242860.1 hypothetical protein F0L74_10045 [Chitinophaga agrisoli]